MRKLLLSITILLFLSFGDYLLHAQKTITIGTGTTVGNGHIIGSPYIKGRSASIYTPFDGLTRGTILSLAWNKPSSQNSTLSIPVKIYLQEIPGPIVDVVSSWMWNSFTSNATLVYDDTVTWSDSPDWVEIPLQVPYFYSGTGNLMVMSAVDNAFLYDIINWTYTATPRINSYGYSGGTGGDDTYTSVVVSSNRPNLQLSIDTTGRCHIPERFAFSNITMTGATANWSSRGSETRWIFSYKKTGDAVWTEEIVNNNPTYTITGLIPNIAYDIKAKAVCGASPADTGNSRIASFWTAFSIPLSQNFDNTSVDGWKKITTNNDMEAYVTNNQGEFVSSPNGLCLDKREGYSVGVLYWRSPKIDPSVFINTLQLRFKAKALQQGSNILYIGVMDADSASSFIKIDSVMLTTEWNTYAINLNHYTGTNHHIAFAYTGYQFSSQIFVDDVDIDVIPACQGTIANVSVNNLSSTGFELQWEDVQSESYRLELIDALGNLQSRFSETNSYQFTNLEPAQIYRIRIKANCAPETWTDTIHVQTLQRCYDIPYNENFEILQNNYSAYWNFVSTNQINKWVIGRASGVNNTTTYLGTPYGYNGMYISDDGGLTNLYSHSISHSYATVGLLFDEAGTYRINYDWKCKGEANDYLQVWLAPILAEITAGTPPDTTDWINLYGNVDLYQIGGTAYWKYASKVFRINRQGQYKLIFYWHNDQSSGGQPPAVIDNIKVETYGRSCEIPIFENFDDAHRGVHAPSCWMFIQENHSRSIRIDSSQSVDYFSTPNHYSPYKSCILTNQNAFLVSPYLSSPINTLRVRFMAMSKPSKLLDVGYLADWEDTSAFRLQQTVLLTNTWREYIVSFESANAEGNYIAFASGSNEYGESYLDDIIIEMIPHCVDIPADSLHITNVTTTSVKLHNRLQNGVSNYTVRYRAKGQSTWMTESGISMPHTFINLIPSTNYELNIRSNCSGTDTGAWSRNVNFWTAFDLPISQYFDSSIIAGFTKLSTSGTGIFSINATNYVSPDKGLEILNGECRPEDKFYLVAPKIDPAIPMDTVQVRFKAKGNRNGLRLSVGIIDVDSIHSFILIDSIPLATNWNTYIVSFAGYARNNFSVAFGHNGNALSSRIYLDNVDIDYIPRCLEATNVNISNIRSSSIDVSWRNLQSNYVVKHGISGSGNMQTQNVSTNSIALSGLTPNTTYDILVKNNCTPELWSDTIRATTKLAVDTVPFSENFEGSLVWSLINGNQTNKWIIDTAAKSGGNKGLYISNDNGISNLSSSSRSNVYAVKPLYFDNVYDYVMEYDWRCYGINNYCYLRVALLPDTVEIYAGEELDLSNAINLGELYGSMHWQHKTVPFHISQPGAYNLVLYWHNITSINPPAAIDSILIYKKPCSALSELILSYATTNTIDIAYSVTDQITQKIKFFYRPSETNVAWDSIETPVINGFLSDTVTITGLQPSTIYDIYTKAICIYGEESSPSGIVRFSTECPPCPVPWGEDFSNPASNAFLPNVCWTEREFLYTPASTMYMSNMENLFPRSHWIHSFSRGEINITLMDRNSWLMTPIINLGNRGNNVLQFDIKLANSSSGGAPRRGSNSKFIVLFSIDNGATWDPVRAVEWSSTSTIHSFDSLNENYQRVEIPLTGLTGNIRIAFYAENTGTISLDVLSIDNVAVISCLSPLNLMVNNLTFNSASLSWSYPFTPNFFIEYKASAEANWTIIPSWTNTNYTLSNLSPDTDYIFRIRALCGNGDTSSYSTVSFKTLCMPITTIPFYENFDNLTGGEKIPPCWTAIEMGPGSLVNVISTPTASSFPNGCSIYTTTTSDKAGLVSPKFSVPINTLRLRFKSVTTTYTRPPILKVGYMTDLLDINSFRLQRSIVSGYSSVEYIVDFDTILPNSDYYFVFLEEDEAWGNIIIDDIAIEYIPVCRGMNVANIQVSNIISTNAVISWDPTPGAIGYRIEYKVNTSLSWTGGQTATATSCTLNNLFPNTDYQVRVSPICGQDSLGDWSVPIAFSTLCRSFPLSFEETFSNTVLPACWERYSGILSYGSTSPVTLKLPSSPFSWELKRFGNTTVGSFSASIGALNGNTQDWLITPALNLTGNDTLEFDLALTRYNDSLPIGADMNSLFMVFVSRNGQWFTTDTLAAWGYPGMRTRSFQNISPTGERIVIPITGVQGEARIAFYLRTSGVGNNLALFVDNVNVHNFPCPSVSNMRITTVGTDATVSWQSFSEQNRWNVRCDKVGGDRGLPITVNTNTYTFTGLEMGSGYTISVWADCYGIASDTITTAPFTIGYCDTVSGIEISSCATTAIARWTAPQGQNRWEWICSSQEGAILTRKSTIYTTDTIKGLLPETPYFFQIRSICNSVDTGVFSAPELFRTINCEEVENITTPRNDNNDSVFISWNYNPCQQKWEVRIVPENGDINSVASTYVTTYLGIWLSLPEPDRTYDAYVRANCGDTVKGPWKRVKVYPNSITNMFSFPVKIILAPNPAKGHAELTLKGVNGEVEMTLRTLEGKIVRKDQFKCSIDVNKQIVLQNLPKGVYLIHLTHKDWIKVEKLIVQ